MIYCLALYFVITLIAVTNNLKPYLRKPAYAYFFFIILLLALRAPSVGIDLAYLSPNGYWNSFDVIRQMPWRKVLFTDFKNYEKGYVILNKVIGLLVPNKQFFLLICAILSLWPIGRFISRYSKDQYLSTIIYLALPCYEFCYSGLRQGIAIGICVLAFDAIVQKRLKLFVVLVLLASTFHSSAILFLFAYPAYYFRLPQKQFYFVLFALLPVLFVLRRPLFSFLTYIFKPDARIDNNDSVTLFIVFSLVYFVIIIWTRWDDDTNWGLVNLFYLACAIQALAGLNSIVIRVGYYYMLPLVIVLPNMIKRLKKSDMILYLVLWMGILFCFGIFGVYTFTTTPLININGGYEFFFA